MFVNRGTEDIYHDILKSVDELQYTQQSHPRAIIGKAAHNRGRKPSHQFKPVRGALLRNVADKCNLGSKQLKLYMMEMYSMGLIDLGIYIRNIDNDFTSVGETDSTTHHSNQDRLITVTEKGYKLLGMLNDMYEMVKFGGSERQRN